MTEILGNIKNDDLNAKNRNSEKVNLALQELTKACKNKNKNLLELSIIAARERATLGEISAAMEKEHLDKAIDGFTKIGKNLGVIS